jgi:hypothetical protein
VVPDAIRQIRQGWRAAGKSLDDRQPRWIHLPIAEARRLSSGMQMPSYCETRRCRGKRRPATTFHAVIDSPGEPDWAWVACADCTRLMIDPPD